jgi:hypothetical protein
MPAALKKKQPAPPVETAPSSTDELLSDAIHARFAARTAVEEAQAACDRARDNLFAAEDNTETLREAIKKGQELDATRAVAALTAGRPIGAAAATEKAERAVAENERLIHIAALAKQKSQANLHDREDDCAEADSLVMTRVNERMVPLGQNLADELRTAKKRVSVLRRALDKIVADDAREAPRFHDDLRRANADAQRTAPFASLKIEVEALRFGGDDREAAAAAAKIIRKAITDMRANSAVQVPKV